MRRITFAREALFGMRHTLPAWYPHEVLGSPFAANLQSFPWIPTRLILLLLDPSVAYAAGIVMAATLSALFTFLYCRRAGLSRTASIAAGGTFACAGYFASRVMAGHLPLLEAYPSLPLLLWLADRALAPERARRHRFDLAALALCTAFVVTAGHPQLPAYSLASACLYTLWGGRSWLRARITAAMLLGAGLALAVWWPMLLLIARSTRVLHLAATQNDVAMPYGRLPALIIPGIQGWAKPIELAEQHPFAGYPNAAYFWDTSLYVGILPLAAIVALFIGCAFRKRMPAGRSKFLAVLGAAAFACSLPVANFLVHLLPGTLFRSPARLLYLSTFCAAVALGFSIDAFRRAPWPRHPAVTTGAIAVALCLHFLDLWGFAHLFVQETPREQEVRPEFQDILDQGVGAGRIAEQRDDLTFSYADRYDDAGGFDSIFLARFNRGLLAVAGAPSDLNRQSIDASALPLKALQATGVRFVITTKDRPDLELVSSTDEANLYRVPNAAPRAEFFSANRTSFVAEQRIPELFASEPRGNLLLPPEAEPRIEVPAAFHPLTGANELDYRRPSSDEILVRNTSLQPGFAVVLESYDPGWTAAVDGVETRVVPANGFAMAIPVAAGDHRIRLRYHTPGRATGAALSLLALGLLVVLIVFGKGLKMNQSAP